MKIFTKVISTIAVLTILISLAATPVSATGCVVLNGEGKLLAVGNGETHISGNLRYYSASGKGTLTVVDNAGDLKIFVNGFGHKKIVSGNTTKYEGVGSVILRGSDVIVELEGKHLRLSVKGEGTAILCGVGRYKTWHIN